MKKISVALAAYCGEKFIAEQIESLVSQTTPPDEIIICDDSPDMETFKQIEKFINTGKNIKYIHNNEQLGVCRNFEKAINHCSGEYIFLCDQDDVWLPEKVETLTSALDAHPEYSGAFCNSTAVDENLINLGFSLWEMRNFTPVMQAELANGNSLKVFLKRVTLSSHNIVFRRKYIDRIMPFPELGTFFPDTWIGLQLAVSGNWLAVDQELTRYRIHQNNCSAPAKPDLKVQINLSRKARKHNAIAQTVHLAEELIRRAPQNTSSEYMKMLQDFMTHYMHRSNYSENHFFKLFQILRECSSGRYKNYSNGIKSIAADIFL
ncbi:MAG: glycosyltransferase [Lentisphaeria bacterium]|nr:glycosyltransferase [Lentisphaeria bacterium]